MNYHQYYPIDVVNGPGTRCTLFVAGCVHQCPGCYNKSTWRLNSGQPFTPALEDRIIADLNDTRVPRQGLSLSGGDPLAANDRQLSWLVAQLEEIPHLQRLRLHTRLPVVIPDRVDDHLLGWLGNTRLQKVMVLHINHANEIDQAVVAACARLKQAGVTLLNQSVLLRDINDDVTTLATLSERLFEAGILPYYLHAFDPVQGAAHYDVTDERAKALVQQLLEHLPGFLMPRLVREVPGRMSKTPL